MTYARDRATPLLLSGFRTLRSGQPYTYVLLYAHTHVRRPAANTYICVHTYRKYLHAHMTCRTQRLGVSSINSTIIKIDGLTLSTQFAIATVRIFEYVEYWYRYVSNVFAVTRQLFARHLVWRELGKLLEKWDRTYRIEVITAGIALRWICIIPVGNYPTAIIEFQYSDIFKFKKPFLLLN